MKRTFLILIILAILFSEKGMSQQKNECSNTTGAAAFQNDICMPSKLYMLSGAQNDLFIEPIMKRWRPFTDAVRFSGTAAYQRRLQRVASINNPNDGATVTVSLINEDRFDTIKTVTSTLVVGKQGIGKDTITVSIIGDSFTQDEFFKDALLAKGYVPKIKMIGLRPVEGYPGQFHEGRGGWTLARYFKVSNAKVEAYNGFWQPNGVYKYWGSTEAWKLAHDVRIHPRTEWTVESYCVGFFEPQVLLFDIKTGYKLNPEVNDIMYDNSLESYMKYDGRKWIRTAYGDYNWDFNYEKYLSMWKLKSPQILAEFLGLNDFRNAADPSKMDFKTWNLQMNTVIAAYHKAVPTGKFILMIPSSTCGILDNTSGDYTTKQNACMWECRRNIIENFDKRESENIYVVDAGIAIDNLNGSNFTADSKYTKPFTEYGGTEKIAVQISIPHPIPNYPTMGVSLAAFIQKYRK